MKIPLAKPWFSDKALDYVRQALESGWVTQGPFVARFEQQVAHALGLEHALACTSATSALQMALHALALPPGSEVLVPSFTFPSPINVILHAGCVPVFVDVDPGTYNMAPADLERHITDRTRAIIAIHQFGLAADMDGIMEVARAHGLEVVEDGACALGSTRDGVPIGHHGRFVALSFHPRKILTTGEGGVLATNDGVLADRLRAFRSQGVTVSDVQRHRSGSAVLGPAFVEPGLNHRMSDIQAAVGCAQMERLGEILAARRAVGDRYCAELAEMPWATPPVVPQGFEHTYQTFCCVLDEAAPFSRDALVERLRENGVASAPGAVTAHLEAAYEAYARAELPTTDLLRRQTFLLPLFPQMSEDEVSYVLNQVRAAVSP